MICLNKKTFIYLFLVIFLLILANNSYAAESEAELIKIVTNKFEAVTQSWHKNLRPAAERLFWALATISITYNLIVMTIRGSDFPDIILELVKLLILFGLWIYIINHSIEIVNTIINSFTKATNIASGVSSAISPGEIINNGIKLANKIIDQSGFWNTPIYGIIGLVALLAYLFIAATLFLVLVESYIVTGMGIILLGFSGSPWTSDIAKKYLFFTLSVGVKLFTTIIVARFGEELIRGSLTVTSSMKQVFAVTGIVCMIAYLTNRIPLMAQSMLNGVSSSGPSDVRGAAAITGKAAASGMLLGAGSVAGFYQAGKSAGTEMRGNSAAASNPSISAAAFKGGSSGISNTSVNTAAGGEKDSSAIPEAAGSHSTYGAQSVMPTAMTQNTSEANNANMVNDHNADNTSSQSIPSTVKQNQSKVSAGIQTMKNYAAKYANQAGSAIQNTPEFLARTTANYAKGSLAASVENIAKPKHQRTAFDVARKIREQSISKQIDGKDV